jgi:hypothetical protein
MKKVAIGCLIVLVVLGVAGAFGAFYVYHYVRSRVTTTIAKFEAFSKGPELERQIRNTSTFTAPASGLLAPAQMERFVAVQTAVRAQMGARFADLEKRYKALLDKKEATALDLPELIAAYGDLAQIWIAAKQAQVDALNAQGLSLSEYRWVRDHSYRALGIPLVSVDVSEIIAKASRGEDVEQPRTLEGSIGPTGPAENQKLVERFKKHLEDHAALAIFGL